MKKNIFIVLGLLIFFKFFSFLTNIIISFNYGTSYIADSYFISVFVINLLVGSFFGTIAISYTPIYYSLSSHLDREDFFKNIVSIFFSLGVIVSMILFFFSNNIVSFFYSSLSAKESDLLSRYICIMGISISMFAAIKIFVAQMNIMGLQKLSTVLANISSLFLFVFLLVFVSKSSLAIDYSLSILFQFLLMLVLAKNIKLKYSFKIVFDRNVRKLFVLSIPIFITSSVSIINNMVDMSISTYLGNGFVSSISYATAITSIILLLSSNILNSYFFPKVSSMSADNNVSVINKLKNKVVKVLFITILLPLLILCVFSSFFIDLVFNYGSFNSSSVYTTSIALSFQSISLFFYILTSVYSIILYSFQKTYYTMLSSIVVVISNIVFSIVLSHIYGFYGLLSGTLISSVFGLVVSIVFVRNILRNEQ